MVSVRGITPPSGVTLGPSHNQLPTAPDWFPPTFSCSLPLIGTTFASVFMSRSQYPFAAPEARSSNRAPNYGEYTSGGLFSNPPSSTSNAQPSRGTYQPVMNASSTNLVPPSSRGSHTGSVESVVRLRFALLADISAVGSWSH